MIGTSRMRRRWALALAAAPLLAPFIARAQAPSPARTLGVFTRWDDCGTQDSFDTALAGALGARGYVLGSNLAVERRCGEMSEAEARAGLTSLSKAHAIYTLGHRDIRLIRRALPSVPIVAFVTDAVDVGLTKDYRRPEGNVTGLCSRHPDASAKLLELARAMIPEVREVAILVAGDPNWPLPQSVRLFQRAAGRAGLRALMRVEPVSRFERLYEELKRRGIRIAFISATTQEDESLFLRAAPHGIALLTHYPAMATMGGFLGYNLRLTNGVERMAVIVEKVFKGVRVAQIPWELPDEPVLSINLGVARSLGVTVPESVLRQATQVVQ